MIYTLLHVSAHVCHPQGAFNILASYIKTAVCCIICCGLCGLCAVCYVSLLTQLGNVANGTQAAQSTSYDTAHGCFYVTRKDIESSLRMAHMCRNMQERAYQNKLYDPVHSVGYRILH